MSTGSASGRWTLWATLGLVLGILLAPREAPSELSSVRILSGLDGPVLVTAPLGDARLFVVERGGRIWIHRAGVGLDATPFLDIGDRVDDDGEGGLLGLAFPDTFLDAGDAGRFYVYYTSGVRGVPGDLVSRASSFGLRSGSLDEADPQSEANFLSVAQPFDNHNGGTLAIRSGFLYLGLGDGGSRDDPGERAQDDASLLGKMLRFALDPDGGPPGPVQIWAKGLRNPYRFSFDRETGDLYIGDVGQDAREEVDVEPAESAGGLNYGWDVMEGTRCNPMDPSSAFVCNEVSPGSYDPPLPADVVLPVFEYAHGEGSCFVGGAGSITGGFVYRGRRIPSLHGHYFFADFCSDRIWSLEWDGVLLAPPIERTAELAPDQGAIGRVVGFGEDGEGELYLVDLGGEVFRVVPEPGPALLQGCALAALACLARRRAIPRRLLRSPRVAAGAGRPAKSIEGASRKRR